ncbi:hypothetical protein CR513_49987, partial [Mucuna pruriens]
MASEAKIIVEGPDGAKYEALLAGIRLAKELRVEVLTAKSDFQFVTSRAELLSKLASTNRLGNNPLVIQETTSHPTIEKEKRYAMWPTLNHGWIHFWITCEKIYSQLTF